MRILHISNVDEAGGTNTNCLQFITASMDCNTLVILDKPGEMQPRWQRAGIDVNYLDILWGGKREFVEALGRFAEAGRYDGILLWCCIRIPLIRFALRRTGARLGIHLGNPNRGGLLGDALLRAQAWVLPSAVPTRLFSCSDYVRGSFARGYWGRFRNQVAYNPVRFPSAVPAVNRSGHATPPCIGMVARLDRIKDHATLLHGAGILRDRGTSFTLELIGDGPARDECERSIADLRLGSMVRLTGYVEDVFACLQRWSLFVYSTTAEEGLGNAVVEALAAGLPCVVSDLPMMREIDEGLGLMRFFPAADAVGCADQIQAALQDTELGARVARAAPAHVRARHNPTAYCEQITRFVFAHD